MVAKKRCQVCLENDAKYRCPTCYLPYCSVTCNKKHIETPCVRPPQPKLQPYVPKPLPQPVEDENNPVPDEQVLLSENQLRALDTHDEVQRKFRDDRIKIILRRIDRAKDRGRALEREMQDASFLEFCDDVLEAIGVKCSEMKQISFEEFLLAHQDQLVGNDCK